MNRTAHLSVRWPAQTPEERAAESYAQPSTAAPAAGSRPTTASGPLSGSGSGLLAPHSSAFHYAQPGLAGRTCNDTFRSRVLWSCADVCQWIAVPKPGVLTCQYVRAPDCDQGPPSLVATVQTLLSRSCLI